MRLTKSTVEDITRKVVKHRFSGEVLALRCEEAALFKKAWEHVYTKAEKAFLWGAPDGFVCETSTFEARVGGQRHKLAAHGQAYAQFSYSLTQDDADKIKLLPSALPCATRHDRGYGDEKLRFAADDAGLPAEIVAHALKKETLTAEILAAEQKITAALGGTTRAKAILLWPEIEPFLPVENKPAGLPALPVKELNALLDLPVAEAA